nr:hypothetical protein [Tanacetum cinerariifolium]
ERLHDKGAAQHNSLAFGYYQQDVDAVVARLDAGQRYRAQLQVRRKNEVVGHAGIILGKQPVNVALRLLVGVEAAAIEGVGPVADEQRGHGQRLERLTFEERLLGRSGYAAGVFVLAGGVGGGRRGGVERHLRVGRGGEAQPQTHCQGAGLALLGGVPQVYFGPPLAAAGDYAGTAAQYNFKDANAGFYPNAYTPAGTWNLSEPALEVLHADGNPSLELHYVSHTTVQGNDGNSTLTRILLRDPVYPVEVTLCYQTWAKENVLEQWTEIVHHEKKPITLQKYASANLYFTQKDCYLTTFQGQYLKEAQPAETRLLPGTRTVDSKLGTR